MLSGESLLASHQPLAAIERLDEARRIREPIVASRPQQVVYTRGLAQLYSDLGEAFVGAARGPNPRADDWRDAEHWYRRALVLSQISAGGTHCGRASRHVPLTCRVRSSYARGHCTRSAKPRSPSRSLASTRNSLALPQCAPDVVARGRTAILTRMSDDAPAARKMNSWTPPKPGAGAHANRPSASSDAPLGSACVPPALTRLPMKRPDSRVGFRSMTMRSPTATVTV